MAFAESNRASLKYLAEDTNAWGVTPASGAPRTMRLKSSKLTYKKDTKVSDELRSDRMVPNIIEVGASSEGDVDGEFSAGAYDDFLAAFLYGGWSRPMTFDAWHGANVSIISTSAIQIAGLGDLTKYFTVGRYIKLEGFLTKGNNNYFDIASVATSAGNTTISVSGTPLTIEVGSDHTKVLDANDVIIPKSTILKFGTGGASTIDAISGTPFATAIAAGQLKVGQKIHVDGLGMEHGTVLIDAVVTAGDTLTINDGVQQVTFQFGGTLLPGYIAVTSVTDGTTTGANLAAAINLAQSEGKINVWAVNSTVTVDQGSVVITNMELSGGHITKSSPGTHLTVTDFGSTGIDSLRGFFTITSVADASLGVTPKPATNSNSGTKAITIKGGMLRNPSAVSDFVKQQFTIETAFEDVGEYFVGTGLKVSTFEMNVQAGEIVTFNLGFMGRAMERRISKTSLLSNSPYTPLDAVSNEILNATTNVGNLTKDGVDLASAIQAITLKGDASLRTQMAVGSKFARGIGAGRFQLSGSFTAYFETGDLFDDFVAHRTTSLGWDFTDIDGNSYFVTIPAIKMTSDPVSPDGIDKDVMEEIAWEAQRDPATNCMIQFDRFSSIKTATAMI